MTFEFYQLLHVCGKRWVESEKEHSMMGFNHGLPCYKSLSSYFSITCQAMIKTHNTEQYRNKNWLWALKWQQTSFDPPFKNASFQLLSFHTQWVLRDMGYYHNISDNFRALSVLWHFIPEQHFINQACYLNTTFSQQDFKCSASFSYLACPISNCFNRITTSSRSMVFDRC